MTLLQKHSGLSQVSEYRNFKRSPSASTSAASAGNVSYRQQTPATSQGHPRRSNSRPAAPDKAGTQRMKRALFRTSASANCGGREGRARPRRGSKNIGARGPRADLMGCNLTARQNVSGSRRNSISFRVIARRPPPGQPAKALLRRDQQITA